MDFETGTFKKRARPNVEEDDEDGPVIVHEHDVSISFHHDGNVQPLAKAEEERPDDLPPEVPPSSGLPGAHTIECGGRSCMHEVALPPGDEGPATPPPAFAGPPAREFSFPLDPFQQTSINALEAGHSVLVAAHTSAGKTVVAQYAFAMALRDKCRVIYTSPLKALSNQKYRELYEEFQDVGLMTGDVTINPNAACLVMTTEILRALLYQGADVVRDASLLVFDEVHYLGDPERGVVWEECIILAPKTSRLAFLSATIPNATQFAQWVAKVHEGPCHVVYTDYRPTPLQHYVFPAGADALYMVLDERGIFHEDNFQRAAAAAREAAAAAAAAGRGAKGAKGKQAEGVPQNSSMFKLAKMIVERSYDPAIVFCFSRREVESLALDLVTLDLTEDDEKRAIQTTFRNAIECLSQDDQRLPLITHMLPLLKRGVGMHHSGLLPVVREAVEMLFQEGLIKVLFATETLAMGLNLPAKTVVFASARKYDGANYRWLSSGEYIQMSGRAGRRGIDERGLVMLLLDAKMEGAAARGMLTGAPSPLRSRFRLSCNMLLNVATREGWTAERLVASSFKQFQAEQSLPQLQARCRRLLEQHEAVVVPEEAKVREYLELLERLAGLQAGLRALTCAPRHSLPFLQPGRLVRVLPTVPPQQQQPASDSHAHPVRLPAFSGLSDEDVAEAAEAFGDKVVGGLMALVNGGVWGAVVSFERQGSKSGAGGQQVHHAPDSSGRGSSGASQYIVDILVNCEPEGPLVETAAAAAAASVGLEGEGGGDPSLEASTSAVAVQAGRRLRLLPPRARAGVPRIVTVSLTQVDCLSSVRVYLRKDLRQADARQSGIKCVGEAVSRLTAQYGRVPCLDPREDMKIEDKSTGKLVNKVEGLERKLSEHPLASAPGLRTGLAALQRKLGLAEQLKVCQKELHSAEDLILRNELRHMQRLLRKLGYVDSYGAVTVKGKVAACIQSRSDIVLTEMLFNGAFERLAGTEQLAAACSCFVCEEAVQLDFKVSDALAPALARVREAARHVAKVSVQCKLEVDEQSLVGALQPMLMDAAAAWCRGARFADLLKMTNLFEGSIVRSLRRLHELLLQAHEGLKLAGQHALADRFKAAGQAIDRDLVSAASLYL